ncbi:hypothetical protein IWQ62_005491 [Dispira parvispora]|uniref:Uncharacterized protein n=1 Tax=Dispira parvispora TaxID=1520584 RepID=A0A9W8AMQ9_9FUNG|nr:hypothetical protein IWQ62_005491 [Dispira parvispora]
MGPSSPPLPPGVVTGSSLPNPHHLESQERLNLQRKPMTTLQTNQRLQRHHQIDAHTQTTALHPHRPKKGPSTTPAGPTHRHTFT